MRKIRHGHIIIIIKESYEKEKKKNEREIFIFKAHSVVLFAACVCVCVCVCVCSPFFLSFTMKWRVIILLMAGYAMIYFVSLLQDTPYPHPVVIQTSIPKRSRVNEPNQVILSIHDDYVYRTHIHYDAVLDANKGFVRGVDSIKAGVNGKLFFPFFFYMYVCVCVCVCIKYVIYT
ncbi:hypothetical protein BDF21DRAFT_27874 [Thamnidium elegans]|nr:hypothetical protein BDF21DRAFT_27874 [Thamnidium elegans]